MHEFVQFGRSKVLDTIVVYWYAFSKSMYFLTHKNAQIAGIVVLIGIVVVGGIAAWRISDTSHSQKITEQAEIVLEACEDDSYRPACYDIEIPKVMDRGLTLEESFKVTALIQEQDSEYWYCHVLGHNVSAKEAAKDISRWTEVVARCPQGVCSNGCLHGAFQERFRGEYVNEDELEALIPEIKDICRRGEGHRNYTGLEQASCYHALGHLTMYITNADINRAIEVCDRVSIEGERDFSNLCYDGAFMQIYQPLEPEDIALVQDIAPQTRDEAIAYCAQFVGSRRTSCYMESWPLFVDSFDKEFGSMEAFCERGFSSRDKTRCFNGVFYVMAARSNFNEDKVAEICSYVSENVKAQCYANSASRFLETDYKLAQKAVDVCEHAEKEGFGEQCYEELLFYSAYNYNVGSESFTRLCATLPEPWKTRCDNNEGEGMRAPFYDEVSILELKNVTDIIQS